MSHPNPYPIQSKLFTPGFWVMLILAVIGGITFLARYIGGIGYVTNLNNAYPWGLWIGVDVASGVALAAGGFTTSALAHIFGRHKYEPIIRSALLTAALGYTFVALGVFVDIGRSWFIWKPLLYRNPNSALFEVAMCVMCYLNVLYIEFFPAVAERFGKQFPILNVANKYIDKFMWIFIIAGVVLSCMHQSSLGTLMLIAPTKVHPLWYTPIMPLLFLLSAFAVGYPMVIFETTITTSSLKLDSEMETLSPLSRISIIILGIYMIVKLGDMFVRGTYVYLLDGTTQSNSFLVEVLFGVIIPWILLLSKRIRKSRGALFTVGCMVVGGVLLNRINVFVIGYNPPLSQSNYYPSIGEFALTIGFIATLMLIYRVVVTYLPVLSAQKLEK